ncbi:MAG TPA: hypothetical protein VMB34_22295 [Acetobacteraceae bacterium]|nr:hypothetical protein [Acetobacteraceae bacterium]
MRLMRVEKLEDCFDGSSTCTYCFDQAWTREAIQQLATLGELTYFADFPRPFYRVCAAGGLQVRGVEGLSHWRVVGGAERHAWLQKMLAR